MTVQQLQAARDATPFRPFTIHMADGRALRVPHRDFVSLSPGGRTVIVYRENEAFSIIDLYLATELAVDGTPPQPAGAPNPGDTSP